LRFGGGPFGPALLTLTAAASIMFLIINPATRYQIPNRYLRVVLSLDGETLRESGDRLSVALARLRHVAVYAATAILAEFSHVARPQHSVSIPALTSTGNK
jgi:hypothetical protein